MLLHCYIVPIYTFKVYYVYVSTQSVSDYADVLVVLGVNAEVYRK